jgi:hypothetical protein
MAGATADQYGWFVGQIEQSLGTAARHERPDVYQVELGRWRVRLEDVLAVDPSLGSGLAQLSADANARQISGG